jgi:hypothetical protein
LPFSLFVILNGPDSYRDVERKPVPIFRREILHFCLLNFLWYHGIISLRAADTMTPVEIKESALKPVCNNASTPYTPAPDKSGAGESSAALRRTGGG